MKKFLSTIIKKPVTIIMLTVLVLGLGLISTLNMPVNLLPDINIPVLGVSVVYPGASAQLMEKEVTSSLEEAVSGLSGVREVTTYSADNVSTVVVYFDYGTDTSEKKIALSDKLKNVSLPKEAMAPEIITVDLNAEPAATLAMYRQDNNMSLLSLNADVIGGMLETINGVGGVKISGAPQRNFVITPKDYTAEGYDYDLSSAVLLIVQTLSGSGLDIPLGTIMENGETVSIRNLSEAVSISDVKKLPVAVPLTVPKEIKDQISQAVADGLDVYLDQESKDALLKDETVRFFLYVSGYGDKTEEEQLQFLYGKIASMLTGGASSVILPLQQIAFIPSAPEITYADYSYINGIQSVKIEVEKISGSNTSEIVKSVRKAVEEYNSSHTSVKLVMLDDQASFIDDSISNVLSSMAVGGLLAIIIIFLFLRNIKSSLIIAVTMPLSVLAALCLLFISGVSLNMVSLGGLAVGIGMLVDNSIVVIEAIFRRRDLGENAFLAALNGTKSVAGAILASTLTTVCVFFPILFTSGLTKEIFTDLSLSVIYSLSFSLIVAITVIPCLYCLINGGRKHFLSGTPLEKSKAALPEAKPKVFTAQSVELPQEAVLLRKRSMDEFLTPDYRAIVKLDKKVKKQIRRNKKSGGRIMSSIESGYEKVLPFFLKNKIAVLLVSIAIFLASLLLCFSSGVEFLPSIDQGTIEVEIAMDSSATLSEVKAKTAEIEKIIVDNIESIESLSANSGKSGVLATEYSGNIRVQLTTNKGTKKIAEQIRDLTSGIKGARLTIKEVDGVVAMVTGGMSGLSIDVVGENLNTLRLISSEIQNGLKGIEGFKSASDNLSEKKPEYRVRIDKQKVMELGLNYEAIVMTLRVGLSGAQVGSLNTGAFESGLTVKFEENSVSSLDDLKNFDVGGGVKFSEVASFTTAYVDSSLTKSGGKYLLTLTAQVYGLDTGAASKAFQQQTEKVLSAYPGYTFREAGVQSYLSDAFSGLFVALAVSFILLFGVMAAQFESAIKPLIIMMSIPFSFTGGFVALFISGTSINVVSFIGLIMLMGVIVNNAIVMLDKIKELTDAGSPPLEAVIKGAAARLRPIFMTTLTTVLALVPLSLALGSGGELMQPLGIVVIGGLTLGTLVTLVLIPAVYCLFMKIKAPKKEKKNEEKTDIILDIDDELISVEKK